MVPEYLGDRGNLEEVDLVCDERIDYDSEFPEDNLADLLNSAQQPLLRRPVTVVVYFRV